MKIKLHPNIAKLVKKQVRLQSKIKPTKRDIALGLKPVTADDLVNELLWMALRTGDISKHYTTP